MVASAQGEDRSNYQVIGPWHDLHFGWCKATEADYFTDWTFPQNWANLRAQGLHRGAYHFFHPAISVSSQVDLFMSVVTAQGLDRGDMLAIDTEISAGLDGTQMIRNPFRSMAFTADEQGRARIRPGVTYPHRFFRKTMPPKITASWVGEGSLQFLQGVQAAVRTHLGGDYCPIFLYTYMDFIPQVAQCTSFPLWIAQYTADAPVSVAPWPSWHMWQYAGGGGQYGSDQDAWNGTDAGMDAWIAPYLAPQPPPVPAWETAMLNVLPELSEGAVDRPGGVAFVHRMQGLVLAVGNTNHLAAAQATPVDGTFAASTLAGVKAIQGFFRITQDGIVGPQTWGCLVTGSPA